MKKLVMLCAVVAAAVGANAATMKWGGAICAEDGVSAPNSGTTAYLLYSDSAFGAISSFNTSTKTTNAGGTTVASYTINAGDAASYTFSSSYDNDWDKLNGYYAMVLVDGANMYYNTFQVTEYSSATTPTQDKMINMDWSGSDYLGNPAMKGTVTGGGTIPEPTSGLLLLVGGAMLALRRKRA